jgi:hypothetical protein
MTLFFEVWGDLFADPHLARNAVWWAGGTEPPAAVHIVLRQPDRMGGFGETRLLTDTNLNDESMVKVPMHSAGDAFDIDDDTYLVPSEHVRDSERLV